MSFQSVVQWAFSRMGQNQYNRFPIFPKMKHGTRKRTNINWSRILRAQYNARNRSNKYKNALDHRQDTETYDMCMRGAIASNSLCTTTSIMACKIQILRNHFLSCGDKLKNNGTNACHAGLKAACSLLPRTSRKSRIAAPETTTSLEICR